MRGLFFRAAITVVAISLASCSKSSDNSDGVIKLDPKEVAALLGISEKSGVEVGDVTSGREGVTVKSISLKEGDDTEVQIRDVDLRISSTGNLAYAISSLKMGSLDVLDWKTTQRAQAYEIQVVKPGDKFLTKLDDAVSTVRSGGVLRTADLSCASLGIKRIDYLIRGQDTKMIKVRIEGVNLTDAATDTLGQLSVDQISLVADETKAAAKSLKITNVDRLFADQMLAMLAKNPTKSQPSDAPASVTSARPAWLVKRFIPFDHFEAAEATIDLNVSYAANGFDPRPARLTNVNLDVQRGSNGEFKGISGTASGSIPCKIFDRNAGSFFERLGNPKLLESIAATANAKMTVDRHNLEELHLDVSVPGIATASVDLTAHNIIEGLRELYIGDSHAGDSITISSFKFVGQDDGILAYLLPNNNADGKDFREILTKISTDWWQVSERERLSAEIAKFIESPKSVRFTSTANGLIPAKDFVDATMENDASTKRLTTVELTFTGN